MEDLGTSSPVILTAATERILKTWIRDGIMQPREIHSLGKERQPWFTPYLSTVLKSSPGAVLKYGRSEVTGGIYPDGRRYSRGVTAHEEIELQNQWAGHKKGARNSKWLHNRPWDTKRDASKMEWFRVTRGTVPRQRSQISARCPLLFNFT